MNILRLIRRGAIGAAAVGLMAAVVPTGDAALPSPGLATVASDMPELSVRTVMGGLNDPWDITFTPEGVMLVTQHSGGFMARFPSGVVQKVTADLSDLFVGRFEPGLLGTTVDPAFGTNRRVLTCMSRANPDGTLRDQVVVAWTVAPDYTSMTRQGVILQGIPANVDGHTGCRLRFGADGALYVSTGDAFTGRNPQDLTSLSGKVLRINGRTGAPMPDNPFITSANPNTQRIYTYGHRNPQGLSPQPGTGVMYETEHGTNRDDEVNRLIPGRNYGWDPVAADGTSYAELTPEMTDTKKFPDAVLPVWSSGSPTVAPSGAGFISGRQWGSWDGALASGSLKNSTLRVYRLDRSGRLLGVDVPPEMQQTYGRLRSVQMGPDGMMYVATANGGNSDRVLQIQPRTVAPSGHWELRDQTSPGGAPYQLYVGRPESERLACDVDGDGRDTAVTYDGGTWSLWSEDVGAPDSVFSYGAPWMRPVCGDWNGDGIDTIGVYSPANGTWWLRNSNTPGAEDLKIQYGWSAAKAVPGDWDGDGRDTIGVYDLGSGTWWLRNSNAPGDPDKKVQYGWSEALPVPGDTNGDGRDDLGVYSRGAWLLQADLSGGQPTSQFGYGLATDLPVRGNWDGTPGDGIGVTRAWR